MFIVGLNPSTPLRDEVESYEHYWSALTRQPELFYQAYFNKHQQREEQKSRTARMILEVTALLKPLNVLITNIYAYPTPNPEGIPKAIRQEAESESILIRLITSCKPQVLLFHGREARAFAEKFFNVKLDPYVEPTKQLMRASIPNTDAPVWLFAYHHFVGRVEKHTVMRKRLQQLAGQIQKRVIHSKS